MNDKPEKTDGSAKVEEGVTPESRINIGRKALDSVKHPEEEQRSSRVEIVSKVIMEEPLIESQPSLAGLGSVLDGKEGGAIYYGTGIATPKYPSVGLPFDTLGMVLITEKLRRDAGFTDVYHHIADTHAKTNSWADPAQMDRRAAETRNTLAAVAENLGLSNFHIMLSSEFDSTPEYQQILSEFDASDKHDYVKREMADMEWYRRQHGVIMKAGWIIQASQTKLGSDERLFDQEYAKFKGDQMAFIYTKPGRTFDVSRPKASPYIQIPGETRILLDPNEDVRAKMEAAKANDPEFSGAIKHLSDIVSLYEELFGSLGDEAELEDKIQMIIDKSLRGLKSVDNVGDAVSEQANINEGAEKDPAIFMAELEADLLAEKDLKSLSAEEQFTLVSDKVGSHPEAITPKSDLLERLQESKRTGVPLKVKFGIDPTGPDIHIGHAVSLIMLRRFEKMGHKIQLVIGDFTAHVGDPTDRETERNAITDEIIQSNMRSYFDQAGRIIDLRQESNDQVEMVYNAEWLSKITLKEWLPLLQRTSAVQMMQRQDFQKRVNAGGSVSMAELMYSLFMAYDSVVLNPDVELGGMDQFVNLHWCRDLMLSHGEKPEIFIVMDLLPGTSGSRDDSGRLKKMSKSAKNYISMTESPAEMYAKTMSIPDDVMWVWFRELTEISSQQLSELKEFVAKNEIHPMEAKKMLARLVVGVFNNRDSQLVTEAEATFHDKFGKEKSVVPRDALSISAQKGDKLLDVISEASGESRSAIRKMNGGISILEGDSYRALSLEELLGYTIQGDDLMVKLGKKRYYHLTAE